MTDTDPTKKLESNEAVAAALRAAVDGTIASEEANEENDEDVTEEDEEGEEDGRFDMPLDGDTLAPGLHLFEIATAVPCRQEILLAGLARLGFESIRMDLSRPATTFPVREHRFIANLTKAIMLRQRDDVMQWVFACPLAIDTTRDMSGFRLKLEAFDLTPGTIYEGLFLTRERSQPTRQIVEDHLNEMGFVPIKLVAIQRDARLRTSPDTSVAIWFGLLEWDAVASQCTEDDPFYFEDLVAVGSVEVTEEEG